MSKLSGKKRAVDLAKELQDSKKFKATITEELK